ncbi:MAG: aldo/keto reductase [Oscillospiraceae bacterium]|nr:aldo/keto reductase [Oscillospiraceae bacterium]
MIFKEANNCFTLANEVKIPCIGFGMWQTPDGDVAVNAAKHAIASGYRHIDTAAIYGNEESVGRAIKECGIPRKEIFVTSKLWNDEHGYENTMAAFEISMKNLGLDDYMDLYLIHWPNPIKFRDCWEEANAGSWKAFEELYEAGRIRAIGVSNFHGHHLDALKKTQKIAPMVNQIRLCPGDTQDDVVAYCKENNILIQAYSPLGTGKIFEVPEMQALAEKYSKSIAQICIRWSLQMGFNPLPKSVTPARIEENARVFDFALSTDDVKMIAALKGCAGYSSDPDTITW